MFDDADHYPTFMESESNDDSSSSSFSSDVLSFGTFPFHHEADHVLANTSKTETITDNFKIPSHRVDDVPRPAQVEISDTFRVPEYVECCSSVQISCNSEETSFFQESDPTRSLLAQSTYKIQQTATADLNIHRFVFERLTPYLIRSAESQEALQQWDKEQGLKPSHARTTLNSGRTRRMLLELLSG